MVVAAPVNRATPRVETLEDRLTPAINVQFDYSLDTSGFFNNSAARAALQRAAADVTANMQDTLSAIVPGSGNTWTATMINGLTGQIVSVNNPSIPANTLVIYVAGGNLNNSELGLASGGAYSAQGTNDWLSTVRNRGKIGVDSGTSYSNWGGMIAFDSNANWNFSTSGPSSNQYDFQSVATHELMHIFGFGLGNASFEHYTSTGYFTGPNVQRVAGGPVHMSPAPDSDHFATGASYNGQQDPMQPTISTGVVRRMTALDYAALQDIGWSTIGTSSPGTTISNSPTPTTSALQAKVSNTVKNVYVVGTGPSNSPAAYAYGPGGQLIFSTTQLGANYTGGARVAVGDFNGDGTLDYAVAAGAGAAPEVKVFNGATGQLLYDFMAFESYFTGGVYLAAGDIEANGRDELVVSAGAGGGPRVRILDLLSNQVLADFWGIADPSFRGGARVAVGDISGTGHADVVVAAGEGGGPRIAIYNGLSIGNMQQPVRLVPDFYAFEPSLTNGAYIAVGDLNGDGHADLICGAGEGGSSRVVVFDGSAIATGRIVQSASFLASSSSSLSGARVAAADVNGDGLDDIVTGPGPNSDGIVRNYSGLSALRSSNPTLLSQYTSPNWAGSGAYVG